MLGCLGGCLGLGLGIIGTAVGGTALVVSVVTMQDQRLVENAVGALVDNCPRDARAEMKKLKDNRAEHFEEKFNVQIKMSNGLDERKPRW